MKPPFSIDDSLGAIERCLNRLWREQEAPEWMNQLSFSEYDYLVTVMNLGAPRLSDIADAMSVTKASTSTMVKKLEQRGLLKKTPSEKDRRVSLIELTEKGSRFMAVNQKVYQQLGSLFQQALSPKDYDALEQLLAKACGDLDLPARTISQEN